jgi:hypothetical protein
VGGAVSYSFEAEFIPNWDWTSGAVPPGRRGVGYYRETPDFSAIANPNTGIATHNSFARQGLVGWATAGGTVSLLAGFMSSAGRHRTFSANELASLYHSLERVGSHYSI